jgi:hypothetical protein
MLRSKIFVPVFRRNAASQAALGSRSFCLELLVAIAALLLAPTRVAAQETPYFVAYSHHLEEPGNLELEFYSNYGTQHRGNDFIAPWVELEYGVTAWWTTEFYFDSQQTFHDGSLYTGNRWENRFRPLMKEHWINPVLYVEFENTNGADKTMKEVVGFDSAAGHAVPNNEARLEHAHEIETKLILSSDYKGWNISENFIAEKNLGHEPWEFGYAVGASRPFRLAATSRPCNFCAENFIAGIEFYGGLGTNKQLTLSGTSHYAAPILAWQVPNGVTFSISPSFGLTDTSHGFLLRFGVAYEISAVGRRIRSMFQ